MENKKTKKEIVKTLLNQNIDIDDEIDLMELLVDEKLTINVERETNLSLGDRIADKISEFVGSWPFIIFFCIILIGWIVLNGYMLTHPYDEFPFILLNLFLSCVAAIQAPIIMMSQNRQAKKDSIRNQNDYKTDLKSELILEDLHDKISTCIKNQNRIIKYIEELEKEKKTIAILFFIFYMLIYIIKEVLLCITIIINFIFYFSNFY